MTIVDVFHFFGGLSLGLLAGIALGVVIYVRVLR